MKALFITLLIVNYVVLVYCQFKLLRIHMRLTQNKEPLNFMEKQYIYFKSVNKYKNRSEELVKKFNVFRVFAILFFVTLFMLIAFVFSIEFG